MYHWETKCSFHFPFRRSRLKNIIYNSSAAISVISAPIFRTRCTGPLVTLTLIMYVPHGIIFLEDEFNNLGCFNIRGSVYNTNIYWSFFQNNVACKESTRQSQ